MTSVQKRELAQSILDAADEWEAKGEGCGASLAAAYASDANDLREVAKFLDDGCSHMAADAAYRLDTIVRDELPQDAWDYLRSYDCRDMML